MIASWDAAESRSCVAERSCVLFRFLCPSHSGAHVSSQPGSVVAAHFARDAGAVAASA